LIITGSFSDKDSESVGYVPTPWKNSTSYLKIFVDILNWSAAFPQ
jgi:hypothetical protein